MGTPVRDLKRRTQVGQGRVGTESAEDSAHALRMDLLSLASATRLVSAEREPDYTVFCQAWRSEAIYSHLPTYIPSSSFQQLVASVL